MIDRHEVRSWERWSNRLVLGGIYVFLVAVAIFALAPLLLAISNSFKPWAGFLRVPPEFIPSAFTLDNYKYLFVKEFWDITGTFRRSLVAEHIPRWVLNTGIVTAVVTTSNVFLGTLSGYAYAKMRAPGREFLFWMSMAVLVFPSFFNLVPVFVMLRQWGWINTYWGLIIPQMGGNMFLSRQFIKRLPSSLIDSARMDGSSEFKIYRRVILPLSKPLVAVLGIFSFTGQWNSFLWPLIVTSTPEMRTLQVGLAMMTREFDTNLSVLMAGAIVTAIPVFIVFVFFQRYFITGLTVGALKG